jgi:hypothetical protein
MASLFVIRERDTGAFCASSKRQMFSHDLNAAALFASVANAEKAIRGMFSTHSEACLLWSVDSNDYYHGDKTDYIAAMEKHSRTAVEYIKHMRENVENKLADLEVVEVKLSLV